MFDTNRDPFAGMVDALNRGADANAAVPVRQQERLDIATARDQQLEDDERRRTNELTDAAREERLAMLADLYENMALLDPNDPEDAEAIELGNQTIQEILDELDLKGEEAIRSLGRGQVTSTRRTTTPATVSGPRLAVEGTGVDITPNASATVTQQRQMPVGQAIAQVGVAGAAAGRRREVEAVERQFTHERFLSQMNIDFQNASREDVQEFDRLMAEAQRQHENGQLSTQITASLNELLTRLGHEVSQNDLDRQLQTYLQEQALDAERERHIISIDAEANQRLFNNLWEQAAGLLSEDGNPASQADVNRFITSLQGHRAREALSASQAEALAEFASQQTGLKAEVLLGHRAQRELTEFEARAAEFGIEVSEAEFNRLRGQWNLEDGTQITQAAFDAANGGDITTLRQIAVIAELGTAAGYTEAQVSAARAMMNDMPMLEARANEVIGQTDSYRRLALDQARTAYDSEVLTQVEARNEFARSASQTFASLEEAESYLDSLRPSERTVLGLDTPEGRRAFLAQVDYSLVQREQGEWAQEVDAMSQVPVDSEEWEERFVFAATMADMSEEVARAVAQGLRRVARSEDRTLEAELAETWARAELARASAAAEGSGGTAFKEGVDGLQILLDSARHERDLACGPVDAMGEEVARVDQQACDIAQSKVNYWQGALQDLLATGGIPFPGAPEASDPERDIREAVAAGASHTDIPAQAWAAFPELERELFPDAVTQRERGATPAQRSIGTAVEGAGNAAVATGRAIASPFQGFGRFWSGGSNPTANERERFRNLIDGGYNIGPLIANYTRGLRDGNDSARSAAEAALVSLAQRDNLGIRLDVLETLLREHIETISPTVNQFPRLEEGPDGR